MKKKDEKTIKIKKNEKKPLKKMIKKQKVQIIQIKLKGISQKLSNVQNWLPVLR